MLADSWFSSKENMTFIRQDLKKHFVMAIKSNRTVAVTEESKQQGHFCRIDSLAWSEKKLIRGWLKGLDFPVLLHRQVFTNSGGTWKSFIKHSSPILVWQNLQLNQSALKAITFSCPSILKQAMCELNLLKSA